jgi:TRAP-type C4-dicarboxylate transport system substrate-binding protein
MTPELEQIYAAKGFVILAWADAGWLHFFAKTPVRVPDDLKAQKLFTWAGDPAGVELWKTAGFNPVPLPATEISTALQTGLVTAVTSSPQAAVLLQWYGHAPNMTEVNWAVLLGGMVISTRTWERVPAELRPALLAATREAGRKLSEQTRGGAVRDVEAMARRGLNVVRLDGETERLWRDTAEAAYPTLRDRFVPGAVLDTAMKLRQQYRAEVPGASGR